MKFDIDLGKVGITPCGEWKIDVAYEKLALVSKDGSSYLSKKANRGVMPENDPDTWQLIAKKGDKGKKGDTGGEGLDGLDGQDGKDGTNGQDVTTPSTGSGDTIGVAYYNGVLYWTRNGQWLLDPEGNRIPVYQGGSSSEPYVPSTDPTSTETRFKSFVFKRSSTQPPTPTGGTFNNPVPPSGGWSDGIPADVNNTPLWMSSRWFWSDSAKTQATSWSSPVQMTDTANIDYEYAAVEDIGNLTLTGRYPSDRAGIWHNDGTEQDIWMAVRVKSNDVWGQWSVMRIKGEAGQPGTSIRIKGSLSDTSELPSTGNEVGDCYIIDGELWVWDGTAWRNMGSFKGEPGLTVQLSKTEGVFRKGTESAADGQTDTIYVFGFLGSYRAVTTVGPITGAETGISATVDAGTNGTDHTSITIAVTSALTAERGSFSIPVTVNGETVTLTYSWTLVGVVKGENGYSRAVIAMYQRSMNGISNMTSPGAGTFNFATGELTLPSSGNWTDYIPDGIDPIYVTYAYPASDEGVAEIVAGWTTDGGSWSVPVRLTGENGLRGKIMRGVNLYSQNGLIPDTASVSQIFDINRDYQGIKDTDQSHLYFDVVYIIKDNGDKEFYYCDKTTDENGRLARYYAPAPNSPIWKKADKFDFVATNVLLAKFADIDILSGSGVYMKDDNGRVVAGIQGGNGIDAPNIFAGATEENANSAAFRVYGDGKLYAEEGIFMGSLRETLTPFSGGASNPEQLTGDYQNYIVQYGAISQYGEKAYAVLPDPSTFDSVEDDGLFVSIIIPPKDHLAQDSANIQEQGLILTTYNNQQTICMLHDNPDGWQGGSRTPKDLCGGLELGVGVVKLVYEYDTGLWYPVQLPDIVTMTNRSSASKPRRPSITVRSSNIEGIELQWGPAGYVMYLIANMIDHLT